MERLFGAPVATLAAAVTLLLAVSVGVVAALALRNRVFFKLGLRNVGRRRGSNGHHRRRAHARRPRSSRRR